jgi:hypothetical protein
VELQVCEDAARRHWREGLIEPAGGVGVEIVLRVTDRPGSGVRHVDELLQTPHILAIGEAFGHVDVAPAPKGSTFMNRLAAPLR